MRAVLPLVLLLMTAACATTGERRERPNRDVIDRAEIVEAGQMNAFDLVRNLRPHWLRHRGAQSISNEPEIVIYIDGVRAGGPEFLSDIPTINIDHLRHYDAREAQFRFGVGHGHGAIDVRTRRG